MFSAMRTWLPFAAVGIVLLGSCQTTQQPLRQGMTRTAIAGSYSDLDTPSGDSTELSLEGAWGKFYTSDQELGVKLAYEDLDSGAASMDSWTASIYGRYYASTTGVLLPWAEIDLGWTDTSRDSDFSYGVGAGVTQFISQGGAVEASVDYFDALGDIDTSGLRFLLGYAIFF